MGEEWGIIRISGLPTLLDIILSYQPPSTLSFNVPVRPEGLPGADSFAVYAGDLSQASPDSRLRDCRGRECFHVDLQAALVGLHDDALDEALHEFPAFFNAPKVQQPREVT
ncbi:MAG: hypothetical protein ACREAA_20525 [Candidatus Polarisedimenticolia bacterium]